MAEKPKSKSFIADFEALRAEQPVVEPIEIEEDKEIIISVQLFQSVVEKIKDWGYAEDMTQKEVIAEALEAYFANKNVVPRPDRVKNKKKVGRKAKVK